MSFPIRCPSCQTKLKAQDKHVGRKLTCPKCKHGFVVNAPEPQQPEPLGESSSNSGLDGNLANLDLGDLGVAGDAGSSDALGNLGSGAAGNDDSDPLGLGESVSSSANLLPASPYAPQAQRTTPTAVNRPPAKDIRPRLLAIIVAGGVGGLFLLVGMIGAAVWMFSSSGGSGGEPVAQSSQPAGLASTPGSNPATVDASTGSVSNNTGSTEAGASKPPEVDWQAIVKGGTESNQSWFGSISATETGEPSILMATSDRQTFAPSQPRELKLRTGEGLPLASRPKGWFTGEPLLQVMMYETANRQTPRTIPVSRCEIVKPDDPKLIQTTVDGDGYTITRLEPFGTPSTDRLRDSERLEGLILRSDHRHLWSPDGKHLFVLVGSDVLDSRKNIWSSRLLKVDPHTWTIEQSFTVKLPSFGDRETSWRQQARILDITWSSEGLVVVLDGRVTTPFASDADGRVWFPLMTDTAMGSSLVVLDPESMRIKRGWSIPILQEIGGTIYGPLVYLQNRGAHLCVINVQTGELVYATHREATMKRPVVTQDGKWLLTQYNGALHRFQLDGNQVLHEQTRHGVGERDVIVSSDGKIIAFHGRDKCYAVQSDDLDKSVGSTSGDAMGQWALDPVNRTAYLCSVDPNDRKLNLKILQNNGAVQITLDAPADEAALSSSPRRSTLASKPQPPLNEALWPISMSAEPTGRGAIIFVESAAFWVETRDKGESWEFEASEPAKVSVVEELKDPSAISRD